MLTPKVLAYVTRGRELLVFAHQATPGAGWQVPAGTVHADEAREAALWREVFEESGLGPEQLTFKTWLATIEHPAHGLVRHYAWLTASAVLPDAWAHPVTGMGEDVGLVFNYHWWAVPLKASLAGLQDETIPLLLSRLA